MNGIKSSITHAENTTNVSTELFLDDRVKVGINNFQLREHVGINI